MNRIRLVALAALAATGGAHALSPATIDAARTAGTLKEIYVSGASAQRLFMAAYVKSICNTDFDVFYNGTGVAPSGSSHRAYSCTLRVKTGNYLPGTPLLFVKRDSGGSFNGVNPVAQNIAQESMNVRNDGTCTRTVNPTPATDIQIPSYGCSTTSLRASTAGVSDVEPALFQQPVNLPAGQLKLTAPELANLDIKTVNQTLFGVAVNKKAYRALQESQALIPAGGVLNEADAARPSLPRSFYAAAISGDISGSDATRPGWDAVIGTAVDANAGNKTVNVCRRVTGSGTQAASNAFFLNGACVKGSGALTPLAAAGVVGEFGTLAVSEGSGTTNVETCLGTTVEGTGTAAYGLGVISRENNPRANGGDKGYRFVSIDGEAPLRDVAKLGKYGFVYQATMQWNKNTTGANADLLAFVSAVRANAGKAINLAQADIDTQEGVMMAPSGYNVQYNALTTATDIKFASRVQRTNNNSCSPLYMFK